MSNHMCNGLGITTIVKCSFWFSLHFLNSWYSVIPPGGDPQNYNLSFSKSQSHGLSRMYTNFWLLSSFIMATQYIKHVFWKKFRLFFFTMMEVHFWYMGMPTFLIGLFVRNQNWGCLIKYLLKKKKKREREKYYSKSIILNSLCSQMGPLCKHGSLMDLLPSIVFLQINALNLCSRIWFHIV